MGSTFIYNSTRATIIDELTRGWKDKEGVVRGRALKHCARGNVLYVVHENIPEDGETYRFIGVHLLLRSDGDWGYKDMDETMGPVYTNCPVSYIELAEEKPKPGGLGSDSRKWRERVRAEAALRSRKYNVGQVVESVRPLNFKSGKVSRFKVVKLPRGGRSLYCYDAEGNVDGLLRLPKTSVRAVEPNDRRAAVAATKEKA